MQQAKGTPPSGWNAYKSKVRLLLCGYFRQHASTNGNVERNAMFLNDDCLSILLLYAESIIVDFISIYETKRNQPYLKQKIQILQLVITILVHLYVIFMKIQVIDLLV